MRRGQTLTMTNEFINIAPGSIESSILLIRGQKVMLDRTLAKFFGVSARVVKEVVKWDPKRFPPTYLFQLTVEESRAADLSWKHTKSRPYAFTEHGIVMLSSVLNSERALQMGFEIMQIFVRLRETPASNGELTKRVDALERKIVIDAIRKPMKPAIPRRKQIGYLANTAKR